MRRRSTRSVLVAALVCIAATVSGCTTVVQGSASPATPGDPAADSGPTTPPAPPAPPVDDISWEDCTDNVESAIGGELDRPL
ncbi:MAG: hypothetical protein M3381_13985, partial [Actinomycetota bacterium]|nr:hypothetical protein [Actinomycetota bacterium]